jgi:hypothetical protein
VAGEAGPDPLKTFNNGEETNRLFIWLWRYVSMGVTNNPSPNELDQRAQLQNHGKQKNNGVHLHKIAR